MRPRLVLTFLLTTLFVILSGCGGVSNCPVCGTTSNGGYAVIDIIPVPEHNPNGEPGGPFNSFDISWLDPVNHLDYVADRLGFTPFAKRVFTDAEQVGLSAARKSEPGHG